jgi:hypothetical protein
LRSTFRPEAKPRRTQGKQTGAAHLSPAALDAAIRLLDGAETYGGIVEAPAKLG